MNKRLTIVCALLLLMIWPCPTEGILVNGFNVDVDVLADNHMFLTGSPNIAYSVLEEGFAESAPGGGNDCPLKNRGDHDCDNDVDNDDMAYWAGRLAPLAIHGEINNAIGSGNDAGITVGSYDIDTDDAFFYIAAWTQMPNREGVLINGELATPPNTLGAEVWTGDGNWRICRPADMRVATNQHPSPSAILDAINFCDEQPLQRWLVPLSDMAPPANKPRSFFNTTQWVWDGSVADGTGAGDDSLGQVMLLRRPLLPATANLSIRTEEVSEDVIKVTVDPSSVQSLRIDLGFDPRQVVPIDILNPLNSVAAVAPYSIVPAAFNFDAVNSVLENISGQIALGQVPPIEVDVFSVFFTKVAPNINLADYNFRVFAGDPGDTVVLSNSEPQLGPPTIPISSANIRQIATARFRLDANRSGGSMPDISDIDDNDIVAACTQGEVLDDWFAATGRRFGDINFDDAITVADITILAGNLNTFGTYRDGDLDCNTRVEQADADIMSRLAAAGPITEALLDGTFRIRGNGATVNGLDLTSANGILESVADPSPFTFTLANTPNQVTVAIFPGPGINLTGSFIFGAWDTDRIAEFDVQSAGTPVVLISTSQPVPEPSSTVLAGMAMALLSVLRRKPTPANATRGLLPDAGA